MDPGGHGSKGSDAQVQAEAQLPSGIGEAGVDLRCAEALVGS